MTHKTDKPKHKFEPCGIAGIKTCSKCGTVYPSVTPCVIKEPEPTALANSALAEDECVDCKSQIEKDMAKKIFDRIEPHITNALFQLHYDKDFESEMTWWQQLRQEYGI